MIGLSAVLAHLAAANEAPLVGIGGGFRLRGGFLSSPVWQVALERGSSTAWSSADGAGFTHRKGRTLALSVGSREAVLLRAEPAVWMPVAPRVEEDRLRVPVRAVSEALGLRVDFQRD